MDAGGTDKEALEAERAEVERQKKEKRERELSNSKAFDAMVRRAHEKAALQRANAGQHGPLVDEALAMNIFSGEAIVPTVEGARSKRFRAQRTVEAEYRNQHPQGSKAESAQQTSGASSRTSVAAAPPPPPSDTAPVAVSISAPDATAETTTDLEVDVSVPGAVKASEQDFTNMDELD